MDLHPDAPTLERRHLRRRCVQCGLAADSIESSNRDQCPRCGCDLAARPPRSYAEMEGLFELPPTTVAVDAQVRARADAASARWLLVVVAVGIAAIATLAATMLRAGTRI